MNSKSTVRELGVPVRAVSGVGLLAGLDAEDKPALYATMRQDAEPHFILLQIDPETGKIAQYSTNLGPGNAKWSQSGKCIYGGASGHLVRFDPRTGCFEDLGEINSPRDTFICRIDEGPDGKLWIGCHETASLTSFDPKTRTFIRYGRMDDVDMYFYPLAGDDGTVAGLVKFTKHHVVVLDPDSGEHKSVGPVFTADTQSGPKNDPPINLIKGIEGKLYIVSSEGNFRIDGMEITPVDSVPSPRPEPTLPDGSTFRVADASSFSYREIEIKSPDGATRTFHLDWKGAGTNIFLLHEGPDGNIYGSSILPLHLFRYNPKSGEMVDLGQCSPAGGEAYSMGNLDGRLYICSYTRAKLSMYDPKKPYRFGADEEANPRHLGRMDEVSCRPIAMLTGPLGRVWTGSFPDYGMWGGPLAWYDPKTGGFGSCRHVIENQSVCALAWLPRLGLIAGGTSIEGGTGTQGTQPRAKSAAVFLWDPQKGQKVWHENFGLPLHTVSAVFAVLESLAYTVLCFGADGLKNELALIDFEKRTLISRSELPAMSPHAVLRYAPFRSTPDGRLYILTHGAIFQIKPGTTDMKIFVSDGLLIHVPGPIIDGVFYFANDHKLRALRI